MSFEYTTSENNGNFNLAVKGKLIETSQAQELVEVVDDEISNGKVNFIVDLSGLEYMNSSGLNSLVNILTKVRNNGGDVVIANISEKVNQLFVITKLNNVFNVAASIEEAEAMLN